MKTKNILNNLVALLIAVAIGSLASASTGANPDVCIGLSVVAMVTLSIAFPKLPKAVAYNLTYAPMLYTGEFAEEIHNEILFLNKTIDKGLVRLMDNINQSMYLTESSVTRVSQAYKSSPVSGDAAGGLALADKILQPFQFMIYDRFTPNTVLLSRLGKKNGANTAFPKVSDEYQRLILELYGKKESELMQVRFWDGATAATVVTATAAVAGTNQNEIGAAEKAYILAARADEIDGILTKLIMTYSVTKRRKKVVGVAPTSTNIATEYGKLYAALLPQLLQPTASGELIIFAPYSHLQMINTFNVNAQFRDVFTVTGEQYKYNNVRIEFVPLPENFMIAGIGQNLIWGCDITNPEGNVKMDFLANDSEDMFIKAPYTQESAFMKAYEFVIYSA